MTALLAQDMPKVCQDDQELDLLIRKVKEESAAKRIGIRTLTVDAFFAYFDRQWNSIIQKWRARRCRRGYVECFLKLTQPVGTPRELRTAAFRNRDRFPSGLVDIEEILGLGRSIIIRLAEMLLEIEIFQSRCSAMWISKIGVTSTHWFAKEICLTFWPLRIYPYSQGGNNSASCHTDGRTSAFDGRPVDL